jgi:hypothetical protein
LIDGQISEHIERLVNLLKGEEGPEEDESHDTGMAVSDAKGVDSEDEDSKIEEV